MAFICILSWRKHQSYFLRPPFNRLRTPEHTLWLLKFAPSPFLTFSRTVCILFEHGQQIFPDHSRCKQRRYGHVVHLLEFIHFFFNIDIIMKSKSNIVSNNVRLLQKAIWLIHIIVVEHRLSARGAALINDTSSGTSYLGGACLCLCYIVESLYRCLCEDIWVGVLF